MYPTLFALRTIQDRKRTCPHCGRQQLIPASKFQRTVTCAFCGRPIPPPTKVGKRTQSSRRD